MFLPCRDASVLPEHPGGVCQLCKVQTDVLSHSWATLTPLLLNRTAFGALGLSVQVQLLTPTVRKASHDTAAGSAARQPAERTAGPAVDAISPQRAMHSATLSRCQPPRASQARSNTGLRPILVTAGLRTGPWRGSTPPALHGTARCGSALPPLRLQARCGEQRARPGRAYPLALHRARHLVVVQVPLELGRHDPCRGRGPGGAPGGRAQPLSGLRAGPAANGRCDGSRAAPSSCSAERRAIHRGWGRGL